MQKRGRIAQQSSGRDFRTLGKAVGLWLIACFCADPARAASVCDLAAEHAAGETQVPVSVLRAITRTETGRSRNGRVEPWPWTVNMEGKGYWFDTADAARAFVYKEFRRGARSFDVGCFQINYKWHGTAFRSIDQMFDPVENARYAARFLGDLHAESGDWSVAAGSYHSRTPGYARKYRARFDRIHARLDDGPVLSTKGAYTDPVLHRDVSGANPYPFLHGAGQRGSAGSLVPLAQGARSPLIAMDGSR